MHADAVARFMNVPRTETLQATPATPREASWSPSRTSTSRSTEPDTSRETELVTRWARLSVGVASSRGVHRAVNEDCHSALSSPSPLFIVADGVGGSEQPARASFELVYRLHAALDRAPRDDTTIRSALVDADREIERSFAGLSGGGGAATVALCAGSGARLARWIVASVGDCRAYRVSARAGGSATAVTVDDTYRELEETPPDGATVDDPARMVGNGAVGVPNVRRTTLRRGEMLLLTSDGVHKHVSAHEIARVLRERDPPARRCARLIALARAHGSVDDATALLVQRRARRPAIVAVAALAIVACIAIGLGWRAAVHAGPVRPAQAIETTERG